MTELTLLSAFMVGLLGSTHCLGMCGGLAAATGQGGASVVRLLVYNVGRLLTYGVIGAIAGWMGETLSALVPQSLMWLRLIAGLLLIAMGLYVSQWWMGLTKLEQLGAVVWRYVQPMTRGLLPVHHHWQALVLGLLWGLLPCGLVYSTLSWALSMADWQWAALVMVMFGLGTTPAMIGVGFLNKKLLTLLRDKNFRTIAGVLIILMGVWTAMVPLRHTGHSHGESSQNSLQQLQGEEHNHHHMH